MTQTHDITPTREAYMTLSHDETPSEISGEDGSGLLSRDGHSLPAQFHPLAQLFPMIEGEAFASLVEDVRANGVRRPVVMLDGMILDGRNRYLAAREAGVGFPVVDFTGDDPVAFVVSENIHRRHLTESQRAMVAAKVAKLPKGSNQHPGASADLRTLPSAAEAAAQLSVSTRMVESARAVERDGAPELVAAVTAGEITVSAAAEVAKLPETEQAEIVAKGPEAVRAAAKEARAPKVQAPVEKRPANGLSGLTREGLEDEVLGLREEVADLKGKLSATRKERDDLKARLAEATSGEQGKVIGALQKQLQAAKFSRDEALAATKRMEYRLKKAEARVKVLEETPVEMGAL